MTTKNKIGTVPRAQWDNTPAPRKVVRTGCRFHTGHKVVIGILVVYAFLSSYAVYSLFGLQSRLENKVESDHAYTLEADEMIASSTANWIKSSLLLVQTELDGQTGMVEATHAEYTDFFKAVAGKRK